MKKLEKQHAKTSVGGIIPIVLAADAAYFLAGCAAGYALGRFLYRKR